VFANQKHLQGGKKEKLMEKLLGEIPGAY